MLFSTIKNILVPVDFEAATDYTIMQAIELSMATHPTIHLLHSIPESDGGIFFQKRNKISQSEALNKLQQWKQSIEETIPGIEVKTYLVNGEVYQSIIDAAKQLHPELIIMGKQNKNRFFRFYRSLCTNELAKETNCPVLAIMNGGNYKKLQNIVVPIRTFIPKRKIELLATFAKIYRAKIHLVALQGQMGADDKEKSALLDTYQILRTGLSNAVEYHLLKGNNLPQATLAYASKIGTDMILVNPSAETKVSYFTGRHINDILSSTSKLKILSVQPYGAE